jgi:uncharacterized protein
MNCPKCNLTLVMSDRQGIEIDYCPNCRGVWLDRGELDKIIERSATAFGQPNPGKQMPSGPDYRYQGKQDDYYKHRKKNWLNELFD